MVSLGYFCADGQLYPSVWVGELSELKPEVLLKLALARAASNDCIWSHFGIISGFFFFFFRLKTFCL